MAWASALTMSATQAMGGKLINLTATEVAFVGFIIIQYYYYYITIYHYYNYHWIKIHTEMKIK